MKLIDLNQTIFVPVVDETKGGMTVEMKMTVGEFFSKFCQGFEPQTVEAIPVEWLNDRIYDMKRAPLYRRYAEMLLMEWLQEQKEQEAR